jgi:hypothetical protein
VHLSALIAESTEFVDAVNLEAANAGLIEFYVAADLRSRSALEFVCDVGSKTLIAQPDCRFFTIVIRCMN